MIATSAKIESYLLSAELDNFNGLRHAFSTRIGGASDPPFDSLNLSVKGGDSPEKVAQNIALLLGKLEIDEAPLFLNQVHGDEVMVADGRHGDETLPFDAAITSRRNLPIVILTADCLPILLYDPEKEVVGAVHAGWKGTALSIAEKTVGEMQRHFGCRPGDIVAAMGPAIGPCCYEVGEAVETAFAGEDRSFHEVVFSEAEGKRRFDLAAANRMQLIRAGIKPENIAHSDLCTCCRESLFYSYRRDGAATGRQGSLVMLHD